MDVDEVEAAVCAIADKIREVLETCLSATIGYGWSAELDLTVEGLHVLFVDGDAVCNVQIGLACVVWLVRSIMIC